MFKVIHSETGQEFGQPDQDRESAIHLMANLNQELINRRVNGSVIDSLDVAPQAYTPEQAESLYVIGQRLNRPKRFTVTSAVLNEAAGTTQSPKSPYQENKTIDQLHVNQYGVPPYSDRGEKFYQDLSNLTAAQKINLERRRQGLPEVQEFTLEEAKQVLGDKYSKVFDVLVGVNSPDMAETTENFGSVGARLAKSRQEYQDQKKTLEEVSAVLKEKNITSDVNSPEVKYLLEKIVNETDVGSMSPSQRMHLVQEVRKLPVVSEPALLPDFRPKTYTRIQSNAAVQYVTETGDGTIENIESNLGDIGSTKRIRKVASDLQKAMKSAGLINDKNEVEFMMIDNSTGIEKLMTSGSGYEKTIASLALRSVLTKICTLPKPNLVVMDEVFGKISNENLEMVSEFFMKIKDYFEKVFVISHNPLINNWADNIVKIRKENNISKVI